MKACLNHGDSNPKSIYPDSFCGKSFVVDACGKIISDDDGCKIHAGHFIVKNKKSGDGIWACCRAEEREAPGCMEGSHKSAEYPDDDAKKYFYDR